MSFGLRLVAAALCFCIVPMVVYAGDSRIKIEAELFGTADAPLASGKAKFEQRDDRMKFSTEGEDLFGLSGRARVFLNGDFVGSARIVVGGFDLNLDSRRGHTVPVVAEGDEVSVTVGGVEVLFGTF